MIYAAKIRYKVILVTSTGTQLDITKVCEDLGWEEGDKELATRITFTLHNGKFQDGYLSAVAVPGAIIMVMADWGNGSGEVARGTIVDWKPSFASGQNSLDIVAYDNLFYLQKSQDNQYYAAGTGTKTAIQSILADWDIPLEKYEGPDVSHAKTIFKNESLSDMILQLLDDAVKKGGNKSVLRCSQGRVSVLPLGNNLDIYCFGDSNITSLQDKITTSDLVTRVKILGKEDKEGRRTVESVVDGLTEHGIRQSIYVRAEDDTLDAAQKAADEILKEKGKPERTITLESMDVPPLRKGDKVYAKAGTLDGYYYVKSIRHDAKNRKMSMELEAVE